MPSAKEDFDQALAAKDPVVVSICRRALNMMGEEYGEDDLVDLLQQEDADDVRWVLEASEEELAEAERAGREAAWPGKEDYASSDEESL